MMDNQYQRHGDQNSGAAFDSMQFGQGIQKQMSDQELANQGIARDMQLGSWQNDYQTGQLDVAQQGQDWNQMMGIDDRKFRNASYDNQNQQYQDFLTMSMLSQNPVPGATQVNPDGTTGRDTSNIGWGVQV
jgi:hypothetical protein